jgi:hypothetical protein
MSIGLFICFLWIGSLSCGGYKQGESDIYDLSVKVVRNLYFSKGRLFAVVIPKEKYSRENLEKIWLHYCKKNPDKSIELILEVFTRDTYETKLEILGARLNLPDWDSVASTRIGIPFPGPEATFRRSGKSDESERLIYSPDLSKPDVKQKVVLSGKSPC